MTVQIDKDLLQQMVEANMAINQAMTTFLSSLNTDVWLSPADAQEATGVPAQTIRHLARSGQVQHRMKSQKLYEVLLSDVERYASKGGKA